jgi:hypothetical protein
VPPEREQSVSILRRWVQEFTERSQELGPGTPNPLVGWAQACAPAMRTAIQARKPAVLISSLFCMGLAGRLVLDLEVPWGFVNPSFYFGDESARLVGGVRYVSKGGNSCHRCR